MTYKPTVDLTDPAARAAWLTDMHTQIGDVVAAGLDATAPPAERDLGRRKARQIIEEGAEKLAALLAAAGAPDAEEGAAPEP